MSTPSKMSEIKGLQRQIKTILETYPATRDNDNLLYSQLLIAWMSARQLRAGRTDALAFLRMFARDKSIPNAGSVVRTRALLQERFPELRGAVYGKRKQLGDQTRQEFGELKLELEVYDSDLHGLHLKPCYCGRTPDLMLLPTEVWVECDCGERVPAQLTAVRAGQAWNEYQEDINRLHSPRG